MTITFLAPDGVAITALQERQAKAPMYGGGAGRVMGGRSGFRVDTSTTILTATSTTWTLTPCVAQIDPGATTFQGMYGWVSDTNVTGGVTAADATYARKDIVYIQVNDDSAGDGTGLLTAPVLYAAGTPSATPVAPALGVDGRERSFLVGTITVPQSGGGSPTVALNPARFAAAGAPLPVSTTTERDALTKYSGLTVLRKDIAGRPTETTDGTSWFRQPVSVEHALGVTDGNFTITGGLIKTVTEGLTQVTASLLMVRSNAIGITVSPAGNTIIVGAIPAGSRPPGNFSLICSVTTNTDARYAEIELIVNNGGSIVGRSTSGGDITIAQNYKLYITGTWFV